MFVNLLNIKCTYKGQVYSSQQKLQNKLTVVIFNLKMNYINYQFDSTLVNNYMQPEQYKMIEGCHHTYSVVALLCIRAIIINTVVALLCINCKDYHYIYSVVGLMSIMCKGCHYGIYIRKSYNTTHSVCSFVVYKGYHYKHCGTFAMY